MLANRTEMEQPVGTVRRRLDWAEQNKNVTVLLAAIVFACSAAYNVYRLKTKQFKLL